jgi:hypothetical protein
MPKPTNLAQLKKFLTEGMKLRRAISYKPEIVDVTVKQVRPTMFTVILPDGRESFHEFEAAKNYSFSETGFNLDIDGNAEKYGRLAYEYVETSA